MKRYQLSITIFFLLCALLPGFAQQTKTLTLLQTSDTHSRIEPIDVHAADKYAGMGLPCWISSVKIIPMF